MSDLFDVVPQPFPWTVVEGLFPASLLREVLAEFPTANDSRWVTYGSDHERGKKCGGPELWGPATREWVALAESLAPELAEAFDLPPLTADALGGGMHLTAQDGRLDLHVDFNRHPDGRVRRLNFITYLNDEWRPEWGGSLYLGAERDIEVLPLFNHTAVFATSDTSWHGHPDPIQGWHVRRSLALYFYSAPEPVVEHSTVWQS